MYKHLRITANGKPLELPENFAIDTEDINPLFNDNVQSGSLPVNIPITGNRFLLKNLDDVNSDMRPMAVEHTDMQVYIDDIPYRSGELVISDEQEIKDNFDFSINSYIRTLNELIGDMECWDVPLKDEIQIGECIGDVTPDIHFNGAFQVKYKRQMLIRNGNELLYYDDTDTPEGSWLDFAESAVQEQSVSTPIDLPAVGFSVPIEYEEGDVSHLTIATNPDGTKRVLRDFINKTEAYDPLSSFYCNARICYANHPLGLDGKTSDSIDANAPFYTLEADRPGSGICFYVLYFLDCLFLGKLHLSYDNSKLLEIEDMKRLAFYTTHCSFDVVRKYPDSPAFEFDTIDKINTWLRIRNDGRNIKTGTIKPLQFDVTKGKSIDTLMVTPNTVGQKVMFTQPRENGVHENLFEEYYDGSTNPPDFGLRVKAGQLYVGDPIPVYDKYYFELITFVNEYNIPWQDYAGMTPYDKMLTAVRALGYNVIWYEPASLHAVELHGVVQYKSTGIQCLPVQSTPTGTVRGNIMKMIANSKNFPETSVSNIINSLWGSFGIKFVLDAEQNKVNAYYIRDIFSDDRSPRVLHGKVLSINKIAEKITGVRMRYAAESDPKEQSKNIRDNVRDYDTAFDYQMSASTVISNLSYSEILETENIRNTYCYIDRETGNAYRWKADKDAAAEGNTKLSLFEVATYKGFTQGDCTTRNQDFVVDITSNFEPLIFVDVNARQVGGQPILSAFANVEMLNHEERFEISYNIGGKFIDLPLTLSINTNEAYDPSKTEEAESPLATYDWGCCIAVMRGGGTNATIQYYDYNYDGFGNNKWRQMSGTYAFTSDSMDYRGYYYDYNADIEGDGGGERFSLKITAYKHDENGNPLTDDEGNILCADDIRDAQGNIIQKIRSRGLYNTFMAAYIHFLLNRKKLVFRVLCEAAELMDIPNHWDERYQIANHIGWINKVKSHITMESGLEEAEIEMYCL